MLVNENRMVQELPEKSQVELNDRFILEDEDGTKLGTVKALKKLISTNIFFPTVEDMKSATFSEGEIVRTLGYHSVNDGGAGIYLITYAPEAASDDAITHYLYTSDTLRAILITDDNYLTPEVCGAYGDGVHDDSSKINYIIEKGYSVRFIPSHKYLIKSPIKLKSNLRLNFAGAEIIPIMCNMIEGIFNYATCPNLSNIVIENFNVDLENGLNAIRITAPTTNITIRNFSITNIKLYAIRFSCVENADIYDFKCSGKTGSTDNIFVGLEDWTNYYPGYNMVATKCTIRDGSITGVYPAVKGPAVDTSTVTITRCKYIADKDNQISNLFRASDANDCAFNISDITGTCNELVIASELGKYNIRDINVDCNYLIRNVAPDIDIIISGDINIKEGTLLQSMMGNLYINTNSINVNQIMDGDFTSFTGKVYDGVHPGEHYISMLPIDGEISLNDIRTMNIDIRANLKKINGGVEGQILRIKSDGAFIVKADGEIQMKDDIDRLGNANDIITLVYRNNKWIQVCSV